MIAPRILKLTLLVPMDNSVLTSREPDLLLFSNHYLQIFNTT
jgi:hypothetical protein